MLHLRRSLLEFGGDERDNLNFKKIYKIDSFKIRKNSWILVNFKIRKIRILNLWFKTTQPIFTKLDGKVTHGPWKKPLDFGGNRHQVKLGLELGLGLGLWSRLGGAERYRATLGKIYPAFVLTATIYSASAALAEVCALLSAILVV